MVHASAKSRLQLCLVFNDAPTTMTLQVLYTSKSTIQSTHSRNLGKTSSLWEIIYVEYLAYMYLGNILTNPKSLHDN